MTNFHCAHGNCQSDTRRTPHIKFAKFPKKKFAGEKRVKRWIELCGRTPENFKVSDVKSYTVVCELHFDEGVDLDYLSNESLEPYPVGHVRRTRKRARPPSPDPG